MQKTLGLLGTGVIGAGWAARALHCGHDVVAMDVSASAEATIRESVTAAAPRLDALTEGIPMPKKGVLSFTTNAEEMAQNVDFIQENAPENLEIKRSAIAKVAAISSADVIIASSTSGFMPSELQEGMPDPTRILVGHPFNPVYLCPLVEIVGGKQTSETTKAKAKDFYEGMGMHALMVRREVPGHLADRLQEAMWREILHALNDDIATTEELDASIVYGPGLRWAAMGMNQLYMLGGGEGGARHFMEQFGPALEWPWSHLKAPELSEEIIERFVSGTEQQAAGRSIREQEQIRDECLVAIQRVLAKHNIGAGQSLNALAERMKG